MGRLGAGTALHRSGRIGLHDHQRRFQLAAARRMLGIDEAVRRIGRGAETAERTVPHLHFAPVAGGRHVDRADIALDPTAARPVGMGQQDFAVADNLRHHRDMTEAHLGGGGKGQNRPFLGRMAAFILAGGLAPPGMGVAEDFDARDFAGIGGALPEPGLGRSHHRQSARNHQRETRCHSTKLHLTPTAPRMS